jgi:hypothetical protein
MLILSIACFLGYGCNRQNIGLTTAKARKALETGLTAWQNGEKAGKIETSSPPVEVVDTDWLNGKKLATSPTDPNFPNIPWFIAVVDPPTGQAQQNAQFGASVAILGDVEGFGRAAFAVGAPNFSPTGKANAGQIYTYKFNTVTLRVDLIAQRDGDNAGDNLGSALAPAGNLNTGAPIADATPTFPDVLVGAPGKNGGQGDFSAFSVKIDPNVPVTQRFIPIYQYSQYSAQYGLPMPTAARFGSSIAGGRRTTVIGIFTDAHMRPVQQNIPGRPSSAAGRPNSSLPGTRRMAVAPSEQRSIWRGRI